MAAKHFTDNCIPKHDRLQRLAKNYPSLDVTATEAFLAFLGVANEVSTAAAAILARYGVSKGRLRVLSLLLEHQPDALSLSDLAKMSIVTKGNITGLVDGLEHDGYVKREESGSDRRVTLIALTRVGEQYIKKTLPIYLERMSRLMSELSVSERKALVSLLKKMQLGLPAFKME
jgi:DNA-binding MarR family transcriptional regulator